MDMEEATHVPLLLGRPFLDIGDALIDIKKRELTLRVGGRSSTLQPEQKLETV